MSMNLYHIFVHHPTCNHLIGNILSFILSFYIFIIIYISPRYAGEVYGGDTRNIVFCTFLSFR